MDFRQARNGMVERQIAGRGIRDARLLDAMREVPREHFVSPVYRLLAYEDGALPIGEGQTVSQPYVVAKMIEAAALRPHDRVLDVGTGSGYAAAVVSRMIDQVHTIERLPNLAKSARRSFADLGYANIELQVGDGTRGWPDAAPFDAILVAAGASKVPAALKEQLSIGGRLIIPVGKHKGLQTLLKITRRSAQDFTEEELGAVAFVPLVGEAR